MGAKQWVVPKFLESGDGSVTGGTSSGGGLVLESLAYRRESRMEIIVARPRSGRPSFRSTSSAAPSGAVADAALITNTCEPSSAASSAGDQSFASSTMQQNEGEPKASIAGESGEDIDYLALLSALRGCVAALNWEGIELCLIATASKTGR